jgi:hypothetical protein
MMIVALLITSVLSEETSTEWIKLPVDLMGKNVTAAMPV